MAEDTRRAAVTQIVAANFAQLRARRGPFYAPGRRWLALLTYPQPTRLLLASQVFSILISNKLVAALAALAAGLGGLLACSPLPKVLRAAEAGRSVMAAPAPLTASGEAVPFEVTARVPARHLRKGVAYELLLRYEYDHGLRDDTLGRLSFVSGNYTYDEANRKFVVIRQRFAIANTPAHNPGRLLARPQARELKKNGRTLLAPADVAVARGIADPARRVVLEDTAIALLPETASLRTSGTKILPLYFDAGFWYIRSALGTNTAALEELIDANQRTEKVLIVAGNSPDSLDATNPALPAKRVLALLHHYRERVRNFSYLNSLATIKFDTISYHNRWDLFLQKVTQSALKPAEQDSVVGIINDFPGTFAQKELALHRLTYFDYLEQYIYPVLRFGTVAVTYTAAPRYQSEIYLLSKKIVEKQVEADALTPEELRYSATLTPLLEEKQRIYEMASATTARWEAFHNLGVVLLRRSEKESNPRVIRAYQRRAATNFTLAAHRNPTAALFYHAATAYHRAHDRLEALQNYEYAIRTGGPRPLLQKIIGDKAALEIEIGQPDEALRTLQYAGPGYQSSMNRALAYVIKGAYDLAASQYEAAQAARPAAAAPPYGLATVAARRGDEAAVGRYLKQAVLLDRSYANRAVEELEFQEFAGGKVFREALK